MLLGVAVQAARGSPQKRQRVGLYAPSAPRPCSSVPATPGKTKTFVGVTSKTAYGGTGGRRSLAERSVAAEGHLPPVLGCVRIGHAVKRGLIVTFLASPSNTRWRAGSA